jgi:hypothetical protein
VQLLFRARAGQAERPAENTGLRSKRSISWLAISAACAALSVRTPARRATAKPVATEFLLHPGEPSTFILRQVDGNGDSGLMEARLVGTEMLTQTLEFWRRWVSKCRYDGMARDGQPLGPDAEAADLRADRGDRRGTDVQPPVAFAASAHGLVALFPAGLTTQQTLREIWTGSAYRNFRAALLSDQPRSTSRHCGLRWSL